MKYIDYNILFRPYGLSVNLTPRAYKEDGLIWRFSIREPDYAPYEMDENRYPVLPRRFAYSDAKPYLKKA